MVGPEGQDREFSRWPKYEQNWKRAIIANWEMWHAQLNTKTGKPRYQSNFSSGEALWLWWRRKQPPDLIRGDCQSGLLFTNEDVSDLA